MRILLAGPCELAPFANRLTAGKQVLPQGMSGPPVQSLAIALLALGHHVTVVTLDRSITRPMTAEGEHLRVLVYPSRPTGRARDFFRIERRLIAQAITQERPEVTHAHWTYEYALGALDSGRPTLVTVHDWGPAILRYHMHPFRAVRLLMQVQTLRKSPFLTTVSPYLKRRVELLARQEVALIPNGVPDEFFDEASVGNSTAGSDAPLIVSVNQGWSAYKNVDQLLRAFAIVRHNIEDARLMLIGSDYGQNETAERWARDRGLTTNVEFEGTLPNEDVMSRIRSADVLAHPSRTESFGLVLAEAMATRTAVVGGARSGGVPWVVDHGMAGQLCDVRRPESIARALVRLLSRPELRRRFEERGFHRASRYFRMSRVAQEYLEQYAAVGG